MDGRGGGQWLRVDQAPRPGGRGPCLRLGTPPPPEDAPALEAPPPLRHPFVLQPPPPAPWAAPDQHARHDRQGAWQGPVDAPDTSCAGQGARLMPITTTTPWD